MGNRFGDTFDRNLPFSNARCSNLLWSATRMTCSARSIITRFIQADAELTSLGPPASSRLAPMIAVVALKRRKYSSVSGPPTPLVPWIELARTNHDANGWVGGE
jgi:hypothetical protein